MRLYLAKRIFVVRQERSGRWTGYFEDCPRVFYQGETLGELFRNVEESY